MANGTPKLTQDAERGGTVGTSQGTASALTPRQLQVLRWLDENPSNQSEWTIEGRSLRRQQRVADATHMKIAGPTGSILIALADQLAIRDFMVGCPSRDKIYGINDEARAALSKAEGTR